MARMLGGIVLLAWLSVGCADRGDRGSEHAAVASPRPALALTAIELPHPDSVRCARLRPADSLATSRAGFLDEVLDPRATHRTPRFDAYHDDSYSVEKADVAAGLVEVSRACGLPLRGVVILGPVGPLWAYYVLAFLQESPTAIRVNNLVMPHARVTDKSTGTITVAGFDSVFRALTENPLVEPRPRPRAARPDTTALGREFGYDLLVLAVVGDSTTEGSAVLEQNLDTAAAERALDPINAILKRLTHTYPTSTIGPHRGRDT